jgi:hypothetical protein
MVWHANELGIARDERVAVHGRDMPTDRACASTAVKPDAKQNAFKTIPYFARETQLNIGSSP